MNPQKIRKNLAARRNHLGQAAPSPLSPQARQLAALYRQEKGYVKQR
jgi:hypothetical protein